MIAPRIQVRLNIQCDSVEEKGTIVKKKKSPVNVWSACEELAIIHEESRSSTNKPM